jgi:hypothetical protein
MLLGCGDSNCVNGSNRFLCSRSCVDAAIRNKFIKKEDIDHHKSNLLLTIKAHTLLFDLTQPHNLDVESPVLEVKPISVIGCGDPACVSKNNFYFCSRSCKNGAISEGLINDTDINYEISNLLLTEKSHKKLFS